MDDNIFETLSDALLNQTFDDKQKALVSLEDCKNRANMYAVVENSIAVLSDLISDKSYIFYGKISRELGIDIDVADSDIDSIWEKDIFDRIHPDDLLQKHIHELRYFNLLKELPIKERADYYVSSRIRMLNRDQQYTSVRHRMFYVSNFPDGDLWLALCLYNMDISGEGMFVPESLIVNSTTGKLVHLDQNQSNVLSAREREILKLISLGQMSKEVAHSLSISINTVNRHRQNILQKLRVDNSIEACRIAKQMNLLE